jgi:uncharacterized protein (TIGR03083 family)
MESSPQPWISALRHSHDVLSAAVEKLGPDQVRQPSYASEWSIAQVLSHLGSQAEIFGLFLDAGLSGEDPPGLDDFLPIWDSWNGREPEAQVADALRADSVTLERFESLSEQERAQLRLNAFGREVGMTGLATMRLGEHALHTWDVAVALDPAATIAPDAVALLVDTLDQLAARASKPDGKARKLRISTTGPERHFVLETGESVTLIPVPDRDSVEEGLPELVLPAEALIRLIYGRLNQQNAVDLQNAGVQHNAGVQQNAEVADLRALFPGF